jgi:endonuclease G
MSKVSHHGRVDRTVEAPPVILSRTQHTALAQALKVAQQGTAWRHETPQRKAAYAQRAGVDLTADSAPEALDDALERILASPDLLPGIWLRRGTEVADAVTFIETSRGNATGFLVSPWLLLTNEHVLPTADDAADAVLNFRYQRAADGRISQVRRYHLDPDRLFLAQRQLDYALVAVAPGARQRPAGQNHGFIPMIGATGKILLGQPVNIIQHPLGRPREVAIRNNRMLTLTDTTITYATDTDSGSSGSPVFNDRWELVALHHRGVESRDASGEAVDLRGNPVTSQTPEELRNWVANEGVRASAIVADIRLRTPTQAESGLIAGLISGGGG